MAPQGTGLDEYGLSSRKFPVSARLRATEMFRTPRHVGSDRPVSAAVDLGASTIGASPDEEGALDVGRTPTRRAPLPWVVNGVLSEPTEK